ncbi:DinB family protein [Solitalea canadensis]|uniref:DinB-like domain-containing protein n=1 Tax=Solitalea canadensis (strain ATCC 29591 / DSM 3403 / JCM 21819 / LMG 8368 / NBRC 15130 / NCIMB 12057 / USAM 9D) TaxID=929556 RepID=H8KPI8_SOLCM|nr:DinB family protein [Solitalea canadensis]AFD05886.1 hypothetical protein Solca_0767 [Solitalea canadensis DSM 3403]
MEKQEINDQLKKAYLAFTVYIDSLTDEEFIVSHDGKWTPGQQLNHILISVKPLTQALILPNFLLKILFGSANRPSKTYDGLVAKYQQKLANGGRATNRFIPKEVTSDQKDKLIDSLNSSVEKLMKQVQGFSESDLDRLILPHPLLGKLTVREMLYFTIYHVGHHHEITKRIIHNHNSALNDEA